MLAVGAAARCRKAGSASPTTCRSWSWRRPGGLMTVETALAKPVHTVLSGPAGGVVASAHVAGLSGCGDVIAMDIGGTSTDISSDPRRPAGDDATGLARRRSRSASRSSTSMRSAPAAARSHGSTTAARCGSARRAPRRCRVRPATAAAARNRPSPTPISSSAARRRDAARRRTDARPGRARTAIKTHVAEPLGLDVVVEAAPAFCASRTPRWCAASASSLSSAATIRARCTLVPFGGAGPMHGSPVARELAIPRLIVPPTPGILCALGMLVADLRHDLVETHGLPHTASVAGRARGGFRPGSPRRDRLLDADRVPADRRRIEMRLEARYVGQSYELPIPIGFSEPTPGRVGPRFPRRARPPLRPHRPRRTGRDRQLRRPPPSA